MTEEKNCYTCARLLGTIENRVGQIVAICMEHRICDAPPVKTGCRCHKSRRLVHYG